MESDDAAFDDLIEKSSLGTPGARQLRARTSESHADAVRQIIKLRNVMAHGSRDEIVGAANTLLQLFGDLGYDEQVQRVLAEAFPGQEAETVLTTARLIADSRQASQRKAQPASDPRRRAGNDSAVQDSVPENDGRGSAATRIAVPLPSGRAAAIIAMRTCALDLTHALEPRVTLNLSRGLGHNLVRDLVLGVARARDLDGDHFDDTLVRDLGLVHDSVRALALDLDRIFDLGRALDQALNLDQALDRALGLVRDHVRALDRARGRVLDLDRALALDLDRALDRARERVVDHVRTAELVHYFGRDLARAHDLGSDLDGQLRAAGDCAIEVVVLLHRVAVDVSGTDLSGLALTDISVLEDVVWTEETIWPPGVRDQVRLRSREIRAGVYQVCGGSERKSAELVTT